MNEKELHEAIGKLVPRLKVDIPLKEALELILAELQRLNSSLNCSLELVGILNAKVNKFEEAMREACRRENVIRWRARGV